MTGKHERAPSEKRVSRGLTLPLAGFALLVVAAGAFGLYEVTHFAGKPTAHNGACARSLDIAQAIGPLARGEVAALTPSQAPRDLTNVTFDDAAGHKTTIGAFAGKTILLNLWATWCVPCRAEMPALDRLQSSAGSSTFEVVPVNVDQLRLEKARSFLKEAGATSLPYYSDSSADILRVLGAQGLPTTLLIGSDGCEIAAMAGPAQWDGSDGKTLIERATRSFQART